MHAPLHHPFLVATCPSSTAPFHGKGHGRRKESERHGAWDVRDLPFGTVVLAAEDGHLFVVEKRHTSQGPALGVIQVAADVFGFGERRKVRSGCRQSKEGFANQWQPGSLGLRGLLDLLVPVPPSEQKSRNERLKVMWASRP